MTNNSNTVFYNLAVMNCSWWRRTSRSVAVTSHVRLLTSWYRHDRAVRPSCIYLGPAIAKSRDSASAFRRATAATTCDRLLYRWVGSGLKRGSVSVDIIRTKSTTIQFVVPLARLFRYYHEVSHTSSFFH